MRLLCEELNAWEADHNKKCTPINWQFTNGKARIKLRRLYPNITEEIKKRDTLRDEKMEKQEKLEKKNGASAKAQQSFADTTTEDAA